MLLKRCFSFVLDGAYQRFGDLGRAIGAVSEDMGDEAAAAAFLAKVEEICRDLEIPDLDSYGIDRDKFNSLIDKMAEDAMASGSPSNTRKNLNKKDLIDIYKSL